MTLAHYYRKLPRPKPPKTEFIERIAKLCKVEIATVKTWVRAKNPVRPLNPKHLEVIARETGIPVDQLYD